MLQSTLGVMWLGPLRQGFVIAGSSVVNAAPATFADAACTRNGSDAIATMSVTSLTAVHWWRLAPSDLLFILAPPSSGRGCAREGQGRISPGSGKRRLPQSTLLSQPQYYAAGAAIDIKCRTRYLFPTDGDCLIRRLRQMTQRRPNRTTTD